MLRTERFEPDVGALQKNIVHVFLNIQQKSLSRQSILQSADVWERMYYEAGRRRYGHTFNCLMTVTLL